MGLGMTRIEQPPVAAGRAAAEGMAKPTGPGPMLRSLAPMLLLAVMWGLSIPLTKLGLETLPPLTLTALRFAIGLPFMMAFAWGRRLPWRVMPKMAALGLLGISIGQIAQTFGVAGTSASVGTIISATIPVFIVVFAALRLKQAVTPRQQLGLVTAFAGIVLVALGQGDPTSLLGQSTVTGVVWMLVSSLVIAFYYVWSVELTRDHGTAAVTAWSTLFGFLALLPFTAWEMTRVPVVLTAQGLAVALYLGLIVTVAGLYLWLRILRTAPARIAASVQYLQPVVGIGAAAVMFDDRLGWLFAGGVLLIFAGLALAVMSSRRGAAVPPTMERPPNGNGAPR